MGLSSNGVKCVTHHPGLISTSHLLFHIRVYGTKCQACKEGLCPEDLVRKTVSGVYHVKCFSCSMCKRQLETGEQMYLVQVREGGKGGGAQEGEGIRSDVAWKSRWWRAGL